MKIYLLYDGHLCPSCLSTDLEVRRTGKVLPAARLIEFQSAKYHLFAGSLPLDTREYLIVDEKNKVTQRFESFQDAIQTSF